VQRVREPEVSVVIPAHNAAETIMGAVGSILRWGSVEAEIIVVDDGSMDSTGEVVRSTEDVRLRVIRLATPRGPAGARNVGIEAARGKWVAFLDADDEWLPGRLDSLLPVAKKAWPSVVVDDVMLCKEDGSGALAPLSRMTGSRGYSAREQVQELSFEAMIRFGLDFKPLVPREILVRLNVRQLEAAWGAEWLPFYSDLFRAGIRVLLVDGAWYCYRVSGAHISSVPAECEREILVCDRLICDWDGETPVCEALQRRRRFFCRRAPWLYLRDRQLLAGVRRLLREPTGLLYPFERAWTLTRRHPS
jgi:succinoglycan biosynthesis protein ExoO